MLYVLKTTQTDLIGGFETENKTIKISKDPQGLIITYDENDVEYIVQNIFIQALGYTKVTDLKFTQIRDTLSIAKKKYVVEFLPLQEHEHLFLKYNLTFACK